MSIEIDSAIKKQLDKQDDLKFEADIKLTEASAQIGKTWQNGWGVAAYIRTKYNEWKNTEAGIKITK